MFSTKRVPLICMVCLFLAGALTAGEAAAGSNADMIKQIELLRKENELLRQQVAEEEKAEAKANAEKKITDKIDALKKDLSELRNGKVVASEELKAKESKDKDEETEIEAMRTELAALRQSMAEMAAEAKLREKQMAKVLQENETAKADSVKQETLNDSSSSTVFYVYGEPPKPMREYKSPCPSNRHVWVPGYWTWKYNRYVWVSGYWTLPPRTFSIWIGPKYIAAPRHGKRHYRFEPGHWDHKKHDDRRDDKHREHK